MSDALQDEVDATTALLEPPLPDSAVDLTAVLTEAHRHLSAALDEAMARAALSGASVRTIAASAGVAPNSVPPRLARSASLSQYADAGKVTAEGLAVARVDRRRQETSAAATAPFSFTPRRRST